MFLHLLSESKFDSLIMSQFEECIPGKNLYLIFPGEGLSRIRYKPDLRIMYFNDRPKIDFNTINGIIVHYLCIAKARFLLNVPDSIPVACSLWGGDFYNILPEFKKQIYSPLTLDYLNRTLRWPGVYYSLKEKIYFPLSTAHKNWNRAVRRTNIFSTVIPYEKEVVGKYFSAAQFMHLPTHSLEQVIETARYEYTITPKNGSNKNILLGNSGNPTNNHFEVLQFLTTINDPYIRVNLPLTYGDSRYIKYVCTIAQSILGDKFHPLLDHQDDKDFYQYVDSNNICIFNNYRQQGIGTINLALWSGSKVYLSNNNPTLRYLRDKKFKLFSIEDDLFYMGNTDLFKPLTFDEILNNRKCLMNLYSGPIVRSCLKIFTDKLKSINLN